MDQVNQSYKEAVLSMLSLQTQGTTYNAPELKRQLITDPAGHYLVLSLGWLDELFQNEIVMHLYVTREEVWVLANNTDVDLEGALLEAGVPYEAIKNPYKDNWPVERVEAA